MDTEAAHQRFRFPKWTNLLKPALAVTLLGLPVYAVVVVNYGLSARTLNVGYAPEQPVPYSHALHVGELGIDCRYCHSTVDKAAYAAIPPTSTCMNCHTYIKAESEKLAPVRESYATGEPIPWVKVHDLPDYAYFNHSSHVNAGVSCVSCHGRVDKMEVVQTVEPLSMSWCLDCHRNPDPHIRPKDKVYDLAWEADRPEQLGAALREQHAINPNDHCWTCHR